MHPGWADTPAVRSVQLRGHQTWSDPELILCITFRSAMPDFHAKMKDKLRTVDQGADTVVWLAISAAAGSAPSGRFWQDSAEAATHLPLAWTKSSQAERDELMRVLEGMRTQFSD